MKNMIQEFNADQEIDTALFTQRAAAEERLEELRLLSNVRQALQNLIVQCEPSEAFDNIRAFAEEAINAVEEKMKRRIHS